MKVEIKIALDGNKDFVKFKQSTSLDIGPDSVAAIAMLSADFINALDAVLRNQELAE